MEYWIGSAMYFLVLSLQWNHVLLAVTPAAEAPSALALLDETEALACHYFAEQVPSNGLVKDASRDGDRARIAATGFGLETLWQAFMGYPGVSEGLCQVFGNVPSPP